MHSTHILTEKYSLYIHTHTHSYVYIYIYILKKSWKIKFVGMWVTLKPSLIFNRVMFLGEFSVPLTVISNSKFRRFLVRILIQKDNTDNKIFKREFYTKETRKKGKEKIKCCKFLVQFAGTYLWECPRKQSSLNLSIFFFFVLSKRFRVLWIWVFFSSFLFCRNVSEFFEFEYFSFKFLFNRIVGWIFFQSFSLVEFE